MPYAYRSKGLRLAAAVIDFIGGTLLPHSRLPIKRHFKRILVVKLDHLGDCFLITPIFQYLKEGFKGAATGMIVDVLCQSSTVPIFENNPWIDNIICLDFFRWTRLNKTSVGKKFKESLLLLKRLKTHHYDLFIDTRGEMFTSLLGVLIGVRQRLGFEKEEFFGFFYTHPLRFDKTVHETKKYEIILKALGIAIHSWLPRVYLHKEEFAWIDTFAETSLPRQFMCIHTGAGLPYKVWSFNRFMQLIEKIAQVHSYHFVLIGSSEDKAYGKIENHKRITDLRGTLTIRQTYGVISKCEGFIGNDSVLAHFAGALQVRTVELMNGVIDKNRWHAIGSNVIILTGYNKGHKCKYGRCAYPCPHMNEIQVNDVLKVII
ncbi:MAG: glycosyltransferase family 9 protein [Candidatus Magnetoovum sp. WYHC-5]|nr:glycosyltransferase family 9 protein [Candidatus Magnetoovum sp. WYHC-5]